MTLETINNISQTQHDLGMTIMHTCSLCKGSPHDVETSVYIIILYI